jgi:hypothetical protein
MRPEQELQQVKVKKRKECRNKKDVLFAAVFDVGARTIFLHFTFGKYPANW